MSGVVLRCVALLISMAAMSAHAAVVNYNGTCSNVCAEVGLPAGGGISAQFDFSGGSGFANLNLTKSSLTSFSISVGNIVFDEGDLSNWDFALNTDAAGAVSSMQFLGSFGTSVASLGKSVDLRLGDWFASQNGVCYNGSAVACDFTLTKIYGFIGGAATGGPSAVIVAEVPEPSTLALVVAAVVALGRTRRRA